MQYCKDMATLQPPGNIVKTWPCTPGNIVKTWPYQPPGNIGDIILQTIQYCTDMATLQTT
jgi:hypothetical protein